jgi:hypothetical protein
LFVFYLCSVFVITFAIMRVPAWTAWSLLVTSAASTQIQPSAPSWLEDRPAHVRYLPENYASRRRSADYVHTQLGIGRFPSHVKKMSEDEEEKFYVDHWGFEGDELHENQRDVLRRNSEVDELALANSSAMFRPAFALHVAAQDINLLPRPESVPPSRLWHRQFAKRDSSHPIFARAACPVGTNACTSIGHPNSCCLASESCVAITDTGLGPVGCCASGSTCNGSIKDCAQGNTACPSNLGGGCCIPDYECNGVGCQFTVQTWYFH